MEPGDLRESPAGSGESDAGDWREVTPGGDEEVKTAETNGTTPETALRDTCEEGDKQLHSPYEEELDPRIQEELEHLNEASAEINRLELQLDDARTGYRKILTESARKLNAQSSQLGGCIEKARPYYEARRLAKEAQQETQKAALSYERAVSMHTAAREMVYVAEQGLMADGKNTLDPTWQEMLNHATSKVNEAEEERLRSEREHMRVTHACQEAEARVQMLQKSLKRVIVKSKPYFELKAQFNHILEENKAIVLQLEQHVAKVKTRYSIALRNLEKISEQIHAQRGRGPAEGGRTTLCGGRSPPVGAESDIRVQKEGGACGGGATGPGRVDTSIDLEKYKENEKEKERERERAGSDSLSVFSLQTIASDLEKYDSIEHLGNLSDVGSVTGDEGEKERGGVMDRRDKLAEATTKERQQQFYKQHHRSFSL
ncbi:SH3-binding domain protein 5-like, a [Anarrhichthys ocellatus]|uniref:SH3-binding domain protein 5-like, a n=1 Tax=Anarrhichthys ocellatus TaxID=433405 RepID=UPI0012EDD657|nr:SH3 domain-binding protein 5-like [Anarrhichthys ocellatus]XP_031723425.1 SH3 domain-binding protein 5-like [Anarrhichthys ocellatus]